MDALTSRQHHAPVRVLAHIEKLDDCLGQFLVRVICGACREIEPEALALLVGWRITLKDLALRIRWSRCGKKAAEVVARASPTLATIAVAVTGPTPSIAISRCAASF